METRKTALDYTAAQAVRGNRIKITVTEPGIYYVDAADISSMMGLPLPAVTNMIKRGQLSLTSQGKQVAYLPAKNNAGMYFYGTGIDSIYTRENIYWIDKGRGTLMLVIRGKGPFPSVDESFTDTMHFEED